MTIVERPSSAHRPSAFGGIMHAVFAFAGCVVKIDVLVFVRQRAGPASDHVRHSGILLLKNRRIGRHDQVTACRQGDVRKREFDRRMKLPPFEVHPLGTLIEKFNIFLLRILR